MQISYPIYILDDDTIVFTKEDLNHVDFWNEQVAKRVSELYNIPVHRLLNIPYCQRRARIVGNNLFCGEELSVELVNKIKTVLNKKVLKVVYDQHETVLPYDVMILNSLKPTP
jgi:hypothetical protein